MLLVMYCLDASLVIYWYKLQENKQNFLFNSQTKK